MEIRGKRGRRLGKDRMKRTKKIGGQTAAGKYLLKSFLKQQCFRPPKKMAQVGPEK